MDRKQVVILLIVGFCLMSTITAVFAKRGGSLSSEDIEMLQSVSKLILTAQTEKEILEVRARLSDGATIGREDHWLKALDVLVDHRLRELEKDNTIRQQSSPDLIDPKKLTLFLDTFVAAYDTGDTETLMDLFENGAQTNQQVGKPIIQKAYQKLFAETESRHIIIKDIAWKRYQNNARGRGDFEVLVMPKRKRKPKSYTGKIVFHVRDDWDGVKISELYYSACQLDTI